MSNKIKAIIYARVSSKEQEETGYSLDAQEKLLRGYAQTNNFAIEKIFKVSESASGKQIRKTFEEALTFAEKNNIDVILCEKIDRLTRNLKDAAAIDNWVKENQKGAVHFVKENFILNQQTKSHDNLVWDMKVAIARFYTNNLSEEVKKGQKEKLSQGGFPQKPPLGYKTVGEKGHKMHIVDGEKAPLVKKMFELYSTGNYSVEKLTKMLYEEGLRNRNGHFIVKSRVHELLTDPFYYGKISWNGEIYNGNHESLISKELFDVVQKILSRGKNAPRHEKHLPVFKGKITCEECGGIITWETHKGHWYGHCNHYRACSQKAFVRQEVVEEQLFPYFDKIAPKSEGVLEILGQALRKSHAEEINYNTSKRHELSKIILVAERRIGGAYRDKLDGRAPEALCESIIKESMKEKEDALNELQKLNKDHRAYYEAGYSIHELAMHAKEIYQSEKATNEERRLLLSCIFSNLSLSADKIKPNYTLGFQFLAKWMPELNNTFEPSENETTKRQAGDFSPAYPTMLRW